MARIRVGGHVIGDHGWEPASPEVEDDFDPASHTITEVADHVGDDQTVAARVLASERAGKGRKTLLALLEAVIDGGTEE